jgi:hypothetical protein
MSGTATPLKPALLIVAAFLFAGLFVGCGGDGEETGARAAPAAAEFPPSRGQTLGQIAGRLPKADLVVSPAGRVFDVGRNRFAFGVFTLGGEQVSDADIALYFADGLDGRARGPFPARVDSLKTQAAFRAKTTADDPTAATTVYVVGEVKLKRKGELTMLALIRRNGELQATRLPSIVVGQFGSVPDVGDPAPRIHTPTKDDVADIAEIETRIPPDTMHEVDFADVLGKEPILIVLATPQLCQSRVCGPTVDIVEELKAQFGDRATFIHMEIYEENDPSKGLRPEVKAFNLPSEPWAFIVDRDGRISARFEGAFGADELGRALEKTVE